MNESFWFWFYRPFAEMMGSMVIFITFGGVLLFLYGILCLSDFVADRKSKSKRK